jgi:molybdopterin-guanine dinucleotide biosynthesis protein A|tara:strand:+ start:1212 stop:1793 length:582 start_codon:yes stop_codon:yes gene_type:complete
MHATGIILAGGKSSRMGEDKGLVLLNGKPMVQYIIEVLKEVVSDIIIISNNESYTKFGIPVYADIIKDKGPVGGIYTGLYNSTTELNFCISCDVPMISSDFILWLLKRSGNASITLPMYKDKVHQMIGVYSKQVLSNFKESTEKGHLKLSQVNSDMACEIIDIEKEYANFDELIFSNINTKNELRSITNESKH